MIRLKTEEGTIAVDNAVYTNIAGYAATNCFGVKGMAVRSMTDARKIVQMTPQTILSFARFAGLSLRKQTQNLSHYVNTANPTIASFAK